MWKLGLKSGKLFIGNKTLPEIPRETQKTDVKA